MAFLKGSFYEDAKPFEPDETGARPFKGVRARRLASPEPILEHAVEAGDRNDSLGHHYYSEPRFWRRIADANPDTVFFEDLVYDPDPGGDPDRARVGGERLGEVVLIPRRKESR